MFLSAALSLGSLIWLAQVAKNSAWRLHCSAFIGVSDRTVSQVQRNSDADVPSICCRAAIPRGRRLAGRQTRQRGRPLGVVDPAKSKASAAWGDMGQRPLGNIEPGGGLGVSRAHMLNAAGTEAFLNGQKLTPLLLVRTRPVRPGGLLELFRGEAIRPKRFQNNG
jgi:hypothetical protein